MAVLATAMAAFAVGTPPASATSAGAAVFAGTADVACTGAGGGLSYPPAYVTTAPSVTLLPAARQCSWTFASAFPACVGVSATVQKTDTNGVFGPVCTISAGGNLTGWCGLSNGAGTGTFTATNTAGVSATATIKKLGFIGVGGTLVVHAGVDGPAAGQKGTMVALVEALPVPAPSGNSCLTATATSFTIAGVAAFYSSSGITVP
ncbi:MAG: hypothetical protein KY443_06730 [Actinobacteria bacterium]|nr:hypothetical protein [Actinomycetota bacterium]